MPNHNTGIYKITNTVNGKCYVGSSVDLKRRLRVHKNDLIKQKHINGYLQRSWSEHGDNNFTFEVILLCSKENLFFYEKRAVAILKSCATRHGYNLSYPTISAFGHNHTESSRGKISKSKMAHPVDEKTRRAVGLANSKRIWDKEAREKMSQATMGRIMTPETRRKLSEANKGQVPWCKNKKMDLSEKNRQQRSTHAKIKFAKYWGQPHTEASKAKIGEANKRRVISDETRAKMSLASKERMKNIKRDQNGRYHR